MIRGVHNPFPTTPTKATTAQPAAASTSDQPVASTSTLRPATGPSGRPLRHLPRRQGASGEPLGAATMSSRPPRAGLPAQDPATGRGSGAGQVFTMDNGRVLRPLPFTYPSQPDAEDWGDSALYQSPDQAIRAGKMLEGVVADVVDAEIRKMSPLPSSDKYSGPGCERAVNALRAFDAEYRQDLNKNVSRNHERFGSATVVKPGERLLAEQYNFFMDQHEETVSKYSKSLANAIALGFDEEPAALTNTAHQLWSLARDMGGAALESAVRTAVEKRLGS